jgi:hypothetical protein
MAKVLVNDIPASATATRTIGRMIASSASDLAPQRRSTIKQEGITCVFGRGAYQRRLAAILVQGGFASVVDCSQDTSPYPTK